MKFFHILPSNNFVFFFLIILVGLFFSINQINIEDFWYDEMATFWVSDPKISFKETNLRLLNSEHTPILYYLIVKYFFKIFGYHSELLRIINIPIFLISLIYFNLIIKKISENRIFFLLSSLLYVTNTFIISYTHEGRAFLLFCLFSLMFINEYMSVNQSIEKHTNKNFKYLLLFILSFLLLNTFIFSLLILGSIVFFEIFFNRNKDSYKFILIIFFSIILFILLNYQFLINLLNFNSSIQQLGKDFYYNFYFRQFFGSKIMGLTFLLLFVWSIFKILRSNKINKNITLILLIIAFSYLIPILYGFLITPILQDKYIIYLLPLIILIISYSTTNLLKDKMANILIVFLIVLSLSNQSLKIYKSEINKPMFKAAIKSALDANSSKFILTSYNDNKSSLVNEQLQNYISNLSLVTKNNFFIIDKTPNKDFFLICYDPTNTYNMCLKNNTLSFSGHQLVNKDKFYQVILFHYNQN